MASQYSKIDSLFLNQYLKKTNVVNNKQASHLVKFHVYAHVYALKQTYYDTLVRAIKRQEIKEFYTLDISVK